MKVCQGEKMGTKAEITEMEASLIQQKCMEALKSGVVMLVNYHN